MPDRLLAFFVHVVLATHWSLCLSSHFCILTTITFGWADKGWPGFVILAANIKAILTPPPQSPVIIGADGLWGAHKWTVYPQLHHHEFLYLAWIPLHQSNTSVPSSIHSPIDMLLWQAHPDQPNIHVISPTLLDSLTNEWESVKVTLQDPHKAFFSNSFFFFPSEPGGSVY